MTDPQPPLGAPQSGAPRTHHRRVVSLAGKIAALMLLLLLAVASAAAWAAQLTASPSIVFVTVVGVGLPVGLLLIWLALRPALRLLRALGGGIDGFRQHDYSLRLLVDRDDELGDLVGLFNDLADTMGRERSELRQRELLLHSVIETSPAMVLLVNSADRILLANRAARAFFADRRRLDGQLFDALRERCPAPLAHALGHDHDALITVELDGCEETYQVSRRHIDLGSRRHLLIQVRHLTQQLRRQEVTTWKKVIRVISHELNNALAPIRSMVHSGRLIREQDPADPRLDRIFEHIDQSSRGLQRFVEGYRSFARLPSPRLELVELRSFLEHLRRQQPFELAGEVPARTLSIDPDQMQQVLVNLVRNARQAGSAAQDIELHVDERADGGLDLRLDDRGAGMSPEILAQAMLPFFSSKLDGTGLGLAISREIVEAHGGSLDIANRQGGGVSVTCRLAPAPDAG